MSHNKRKGPHDTLVFALAFIPNVQHWRAGLRVEGAVGVCAGVRVCVWVCVCVCVCVRVCVWACAWGGREVSRPRCLSYVIVISSRKPWCAEGNC